MKFAIVGDPVSHSRSPAIHNAAFEHLGIDASFGFKQVAHDDFDLVVELFRSGDLTGASVTMPHKLNAFAGVDTRSETATRTGAVNTIVIRDGQLHGHNTDVAGVTHALKVSGADDSNPILVLGSGGAAAAALDAVAGNVVFVSARTAIKTEDLARSTTSDVTVVPWGQAVQFATVINATPLGMAGESLPPGVVERAGALIDMTYGRQRSPAIALAISLGLPHADGLTMLVGQAIEAFEMFTGTQAPAAVMEAAAREE